jgi:CRISPR/Cas system-associated protein Cas5 (RAMP superfamily)
MNKSRNKKSYKKKSQNKKSYKKKSYKKKSYKKNMKFDGSIEDELEKNFDKLFKKHFDPEIILIKKDPDTFDTEPFEFQDVETSFKISCYLHRISIKDKIVWVLDVPRVSIKEEERNKGLFKTIILYLEKFCKEHSIPLYVNNIINKDLWKNLNKNGYHIIYGWGWDKKVLQPMVSHMPDNLEGEIHAVKFYEFSDEKVTGK